MFHVYSSLYPRSIPTMDVSIWQFLLIILLDNSFVYSLPILCYAVELLDSGESDLIFHSGNLPMP